MTEVGQRAISYPPVHRLDARRQRIGNPASGAAWARSYRHRLWWADGAAIGLATLVGQTALLRFGGNPFTAGSWYFGYLAISVAIAIAWLLLLAAFNTRDPRVVGIGFDEYKRVASASMTVFGLVFVTFLILDAELSRGFFALVIPAGVTGLVGERWLMRQWLTRQRSAGHYLSRVIVIGRIADVRYVIGQIDKKSGAAYEVIGVVLAGGTRTGTVTVGRRTVPVLARLDNVVEAVGAVGADAVIVAGSLPGGGRYISTLGWMLEESSTELVLATGLTNVAGPRIHWRPVEGLPLMHVELPQYAGAKHVVKRMLDVTLSGLALLVLAPVLLVIAVVVARDSEGPALFKQERIGRSGEPFLMLKFRSMVVTAEDDLAALAGRNEGAGPLFKLENDPRVTRVGRFLRAHSLDELPQFWNVFVGDMSLVGPRPPLLREVESYEATVHRRLYIKPGITGMWQINGRSELDWEESVRLDLYYVENWSITGDLVILWRTARLVFNPVGAY